MGVALLLMDENSCINPPIDGWKIMRKEGH
jgi:hypothetical protein